MVGGVAEGVAGFCPGGATDGWRAVLAETHKPKKPKTAMLEAIFFIE